MSQRELEIKKTDQAWNKLYNRLEREGELADASRRSFIRSALWKGASVAAAVIVLCIYLSVAYFLPDASGQQQQLCMQQNREHTTLVTTLEDGSVVYLAGETSLQYPEHFATGSREVSLSGSALFDVTGNRSRPFLIETEEVRIEVLGTAFDVRSNDHAPFELSVQRGEVKVTLKKSGHDIHVKAGQTVKLLAQQWQLSATENPRLFDRYTTSMRFKDQRLGDILRVINRQTPEVQLQTSPAALGERLLTVTFSNNSPEAMAELICLALNLKCTPQEGILMLTE